VCWLHASKRSSRKNVTASKHTPRSQSTGRTRKGYQRRVAQQSRSNTARLETCAATSEFSQQNPAGCQPRRVRVLEYCATTKSVRGHSLAPIAYAIRCRAQADAWMRVSEGLTSRLRASSRALDRECLIGRGAVRIPCKYFMVGLVDRTTAESGWETWRPRRGACLGHSLLEQCSSYSSLHIWTPL
jgi:hypothetical protein